MREKYLGDSYDIVKRFCADTLRRVAPLYAHPNFVPLEIRSHYTSVTTSPVLDLIMNSLPSRSFGLLLDPDTGIPLPSSSLNKPRLSHAPLSFIISVNVELRPAFMICFDQSYHRKHPLSRRQQLESKREFLREHGIQSFYYHSHAPFLFMADET